MLTSKPSSAVVCQARKPAAGRTARNRRLHRIPRIEALESREVLSADLMPGLQIAAAGEVRFDVSIHGTEIQFSELGLPAAMAGDIYSPSGEAGSAAKIGRYEEALSPILADINGDQVPDFVGTTGVATFEFFVSTSGPRFQIGSITTLNTSYIQGMTLTGQMVVGSQGTISESTHLLGRLSGGFVSQSIVSLAPTFQMQTEVQFTVSLARPFSSYLAISGKLDDDAGGKPSRGQPADDDVFPAKQGRAGRGQHDTGPSNSGSHHGKHWHGSDVSHTARQNRAHDKSLAEHCDWHGDALADDLAESLC